MGPSDVVYMWHGGRSRSRIDCFFMSPEAAAKFPLASCTAREHPLSDHTPIVWEDGSQVQLRGLFRLQNSWFDESDFRSLVEASWSKPIEARNTTNKLYLKLQRLKTEIIPFSKNLQQQRRADRELAQELVSSLDSLEAPALYLLTCLGFAKKL